MHFMNKQHGKHMGAKEEPAEKEHDKITHHGEGGKHPHIHIHHAAGKVHVHVMHHDSAPEHHEHDENDTEGIKSHIDQHYGSGGAGQGQDEGASLEDLMAEEPPAR